MMWIAIFVFILLGFCFVYGPSIEKNWEIDIYRDQSDWQEDESIISHFGFRYIQLAQFAVLLSFEALLSAVYGYVYGLAYVSWLIIGTAFFGAVLSYYGGMYALRNQGHTLNYVIKQKFGKFWHIVSTVLLLGVIALLLSNSYTVFSKACNLPSHLLLIYCGCVMLFFSFCSARQMAVLFSGVGIFSILMLIFFLVGSGHQLSMIEYGADNFLATDLKRAFPLAFFVIAVGSINCLQGLQSSLLAPMIKNEKLGRKIFFGGAVYCGLFLILLNTLIAAWNPHIDSFQLTLMKENSPYKILQNMAFGAGGKNAMLLIFALSITLFLSFVGCMTRLARNLIAETKIGEIKFLSGIVSVVIITSAVLFLNQYEANTSYVTAATQLVGIFCCCTLICFLKSENKKYHHLIWPTILILLALTSYVLLTIFRFTPTLSNGIIVSTLLISMVCRALYQNRELLKEKWQAYSVKQAERRKINKEKALIKKQEKAEAKKLKQEEENRRKQEKAEARKQKEEQKKKEQERKKQEKERKEQEKERKKQETLSLLIKQDETGGKNLEEQNLEKEIMRLTAERDEIDRRIKEIENELEKEQSKRLLLETSESVVNKMQEQEDGQLISEIEKLDEELSATENNVDLGTLIDDNINEENSPKSLAGFDFDLETPRDDSSDKKQKTRNKNRKNRKRSNFNKNN